MNSNFSTNWYKYSSHVLWTSITRYESCDSNLMQAFPAKSQLVFFEPLIQSKHSSYQCVPNIHILQRDSNKIRLRNVCGIYRHAFVRSWSANRLILWDAVVRGFYQRDKWRLPQDDRSNLRQLVSCRRVSHRGSYVWIFLSGVDTKSMQSITMTS